MPSGALKRKTGHIEDLLTKAVKVFAGSKDFLKTQHHLNQFAQSEIKKLSETQKNLKAIAKGFENLEIDSQIVKKIEQLYENLLTIRDKILERKQFYAQEFIQYSPEWAKRLLWEVSKLEDSLDDILEDIALAPALLKLTRKADMPGKPWREVWAGSKSK